jgi:Ni/Co efflux regulator RcnB
VKQNKKNNMKKLSSILLASFFAVSFTLSAQDIADNSQKNTETKTECDSKVKETKKASGFNFTKTNTYGKANCSSSAKKSSCSKSDKQSCSKSTAKSSCCKSKTAKKDEASCSKTAAKSSCCKSKTANKEVSDDSKAMNKKASEKVRLAIANNEISTEEGRVRLAKLNKKKKN